MIGRRRSFPLRPLLALLPLLLAVILGAGCAAHAPERPDLPQAATSASSPLAASVTITRDSWGVPHVTAPTDEGCVFGYLYAQAEDAFPQVEDNVVSALGRAAEIHGEESVADDLLARALETERLSKEEYGRATPRLRALCDAAAAGLNVYLETHPSVTPRVVRRFEGWHVIAVSRWAVYQLFVADIAGIDPEELLEMVAGTSDETGPTAHERHLAHAPLTGPLVKGSNAWAIGPSRSATGEAMLFINPHLTFFGPTRLYEGHLRSEEGWNVSGASLLGFPFPVLGHNDVLGWSHTVNVPDIADFYVEDFNDPENALHYRYGDRLRTATEWNETLSVRTGSSLEAKTVTLRRTHHGPVVAIRGGKPLSIRLAHWEEGGLLDEWYAMGRARTLAEFRAAMSSLALPMFNTAYADSAGNIFYIWNAAIPRRPSGPDWREPVDGSTPETEWTGYYGIDELPQVLNPKAGFVQNCNSTPFATTATGDDPSAETFPPEMVDEVDTPRAEWSRHLLSEGPSWTLDRLAKTAFDTTVPEAGRLLPDLIREWEEVDRTDPGRAAKTADALALLKSWDRVSRTDSVPMTLFMTWWQRFRRQDPAAPAATPRLDALEWTLQGITSIFGTWRVPWGDANRLQRVGEGQPFSDRADSLPVAGASGDTGILFCFYTRAEKDQKRRYGYSGHHYVSVISFGRTPSARSILPFGQSGDPRSPHYLDQAPLYARGEFKPAWFDASEIAAHAERTYHPGDRRK